MGPSQGQGPSRSGDDDASRAFDDATSVRSVSFAPSLDYCRRDRAGQAPARSRAEEDHRGEVRRFAAAQCGVCGAAPLATGYRYLAACCFRALCRGCAADVRSGAARPCDCPVVHPLEDADVVELLHRHADAGHVAAACRLGIAFARGQFGLARNSRRAAAASAKSNLSARRLAETVFMLPV